MSLLQPYDQFQVWLDKHLGMHCNIVNVSMQCTSVNLSYYFYLYSLYRAVAHVSNWLKLFIFCIRYENKIKISAHGIFNAEQQVNGACNAYPMLIN
jgi:hypothetical protein